MLKYIIRLDDATPTMDWNKWNKIFQILDKYNIKPIIAVIPNNEDQKMIIDKYNKNFWNEVRLWQDKGYHIAMHGYNHKYITQKSGIIPINKLSEFAGVDINIQKEKIKKGWEIFLKHNIKPDIWIAPAHSFDYNTLKVLKETDIFIISDGIAFYPYNKYNFYWLPQQLWWYVEKQEGIWTICLHPNNMNDNKILELEQIIKNNIDKFQIDINKLYKTFENRNLNFKDKLYYRWFFIRRKLSYIKTQIIKFSKSIK